MIMQPTVDISKYTDARGAISPQGEEALRNESERWFAELAELRRSVHAGVCAYKGRINEKLQERSPEAYGEIGRIIAENAYSRTARYDDELTQFACTAEIYRLEAGSVERTIYDHIEYIDDFAGIYTKVLFLYRRMLMGLPVDDAAAAVEACGLSVFALKQLLLAMPIGGKKEIALKLAAYYRGKELNSAADYLSRMEEADHG